MNVPPISDVRWRHLVTGRIRCDLEFLAAKILLGRLSAIVSYDPSKVGPSTEELRALFLKNLQAPKVQSDLLKIFGTKYRMGPANYELQDVVRSLEEGRSLLLAGSEAMLNRVPAGSWIGGTTPHIEGGGTGASQSSRVFATEIPDFNVGVDLEIYESPEELRQIYRQAPENGFSVLIIPASGKMHQSFALEAPSYPDFATRPLAGWISGVPIRDLGRVLPRVYCGKTGRSYTDAAAVMKVHLPTSKYAEIGIVNIFEQGSGDDLMVESDGFIHSEVLVNGEKRPFADFVAHSWLDTRLPLVADYNGLMINSSFQKIDTQTKAVHFYSPLFRGVKYRVAAPVLDYEAEFLRRMPETRRYSSIFSFNCFLNYLLLAEIEGSFPDALLGPTTFGEVAYQLLNQTMVYVTIGEMV
jgi:hypothetical protein